MRLDDLRPSGNVDDRRGMGGGGRMIFGGGGLGLVGVLVVSLLFGVNPMELLDSSSQEVSTAQPGAPRADDAAFQFARQIVGSAEDVWTPLLQQQGVRFVPATLTIYDVATPTGCGQGQAAAGPFYCPGDAHIYIDLTFFNELASRFGAPGDFARAYVIAHEYGHHIQNLLGAMERRGANAPGAEGGSVRTELQADCYAGIWAHQAQQRFSILQGGDVEEGLRAAAAVGDDTLAKQGQGYAVPDSFTHGTSEQRMRWFRAGLDSGALTACDTVSASRL